MPIKASLVEQGQNSLTLQWSDGSQTTYDYLWLRDNCTSAFHASTLERNFDLLSVPETLLPRAATIDDDELSIEWAHDGHRSTYTLAWLRDNDYANNTESVSERQFTSTSWNASYLQDIPRQACSSLLNDDAVLLQWLLILQDRGLVLVCDIPTGPDLLEQIAARISHMRETNFGVTFDVKSKPNPNNQAYTADALALHSDLPNQELPPGYQFLHCIENNANGGDSLFVDGFAVAEHIGEHYPNEYKLLSTVAIPFRFHDDNYDLYERKPVIGIDSSSGAPRVSEINFNAHIASTFSLAPELMRPYYLAYRCFMAELRKPDFRVQLKLAAGEMAVFDNRRVLHGRTGFDPDSGSRYLRGCYVDRGDLKSRIRVLQQRN